MSPTYDKDADPRYAEKAGADDSDIYAPDELTPSGTEIEPQTIAPASAKSRAEGFKRVPKRKNKQDYEEEQSKSAEAAIELQKRLAARRAEVSELARKELDSEYVWYVQCPDQDCQGPGIWIHRRPFGVLTANDWSASYKPRGIMWPSHNDQPPRIYCQCCHEQGRTVELRMLHQNGKPVANQRWVQRITRKEYESLVGSTEGSGEER